MSAAAARREETGSPLGDERADLSAASLVRLLDSAPEVTLLIDAELRIRWASLAAENLFGGPLADILGVSMTEFILDKDLPLVAESIAFVHDTGTYGRPLAFHLRRRDGSVRAVEGIAHNRLDDPEVEAYVAVVRDNTDHDLVDQVLGTVMANAPIDATLEIIAELAGEQLGADDVAIAFDFDRSRSAHFVLRGPNRDLWPVRVDEAPWSRPSTDAEPDIEATASLPPRLVSAAIAAGRPGWMVVEILRPATRERLGLLGLWFTETDRRSPAQFQALRRVVDLTAFALERWRYDELLRHAARYDQLTDLPNRDHFFERLRAALADASDARPVGVLYLDLDGFKLVNDTYGHGMGDRVLEIVAERLQGAVRTGDLVARLGGDEFAVVCPDVASPDEVGAVADRLIAAVRDPMVAEDHRVAVGASIGITLGRSGEDPDAVLQRADTALYEVKRTQRGVWRMAEEAGT